ncbi:MAG TPA: type II toxin-antitoxin system Phd/YefM family antitoxin [Nitrospirota bacterium]
MKQNTTVKTIEALEARVHLGSVMDEVEKTNTRILVSKRGRPKVIMLSVNDYLENILKEDRLLAQVHLKAGKTGLSEVSEKDIEAEIKAERKAQAGKVKGKHK